MKPSFLICSILIFAVMLIFASCEPSIEISPYPNMQFDQVKAYKMDGQYSKVIEDGKLSPHISGKGAVLNDAQVMQLLKIINSADSYGEEGASCFEPHLGFVFYNVNQEQVAHATVCLACSWVRTTPKSCSSPLSRKGSKALRELEKEIFN